MILRGQRVNSFFYSEKLGDFPKLFANPGSQERLQIIFVQIVGTKYTTQRNEFLQFSEVCLFKKITLMTQIVDDHPDMMLKSHILIIRWHLLDCYIADVDC